MEWLCVKWLCQTCWQRKWRLGWNSTSTSCLFFVILLNLNEHVKFKSNYRFRFNNLLCHELIVCMIQNFKIHLKCHLEFVYIFIVSLIIMIHFCPFYNNVGTSPVRGRTECLWSALCTLVGFRSVVECTDRKWEIKVGHHGPVFQCIMY